MISLTTEVRRFDRQVDSLIAVVRDSERLEFNYQKLIAETAMLRLFYHMDATMEGIALKILANAPYVDGTRATLLQPPFRSVTAAAGYMLGRRRGGRATYLSWTTKAQVESNLAGLLPLTEHFLSHRSTFDAIYEDMRSIRNHIAHGTRSTRLHFANVVRNTYPASPNGVTSGKLLVCRRPVLRAPQVGNAVPRAIEQYLLWSKLFFKTLARA